MLLECRDLVKSYGSNVALKGINLELEKGKIIGLLGPNGSGKTTLIKIINGLLCKNSGDISICGLPVGVESKKHVSYLPERTYLDLDMKVCECVQMFKDFYEDFDKEKALRIIDTLKIDPNAKLRTLSKGTKEKVQLVLVMSRNTDLYILDEPIAGVDPAARDFILNLIISNLNPNASLMICTHLIYDIESILDDVVFINEGRIVLHRNADELRAENNGSINDAFREAFRCF
ncbi:MAG: ABC transporter ATP-binding protein [Anaeroplasmataceae bacterium]|nr:ABC transporter ATP-binding protein [Anaeroplasmataceae bacterium]MDE7100514.1 ABC transporter ATP-binding protein [Anaeroplasmataceae bacterium]